jgi:hypothetical protein
MRVSRADLAASAALLLLLAPPAFAQFGAPIPLVPASPSTKPAPAAPAAPEAPAGGSDDISATPLAPMDPSWVGILGPADGAFPRTLWATTPRAVVLAALPLLQPTTSPVLQDLARRLLLSDAIAPSGQDAAGKPGLAELRLDRVLALGRIDGIPLIAALPQAQATETFDRDSVELHFAANDINGACRLAQDRAARYHDGWWDRALVACQALTGHFDEAALGLSALRERNSLNDPAFEALIETIDGHRRKLDSLPEPTPMRMALLAAAKLPLPADALASAGPAALAVWATSDKVPALQRLAAGEKAQAFGALPPDGLGLVYGSITATSDEQDAALTKGKLPADARGRAVLYDIARANVMPATRVAALTPLLADARRRGAYVTMARLVAPLVAELQPASLLRGFAGDAARVLLVAGHADLAAAWIGLAKQPQLRVVADLARPPASDDDAPPVKDAVAALMAHDATAAPGQIDLLAALMSALGQPITGIDLAPLLQAPHMGSVPGAALWLDQQQAAAGGRVGETVLTSLLIAAAGDHLTREPILLARVVSGLKAVGLEADARALAVEAALDAGI